MKVWIHHYQLTFKNQPLYISSENSFIYEPWAGDFSLVIGPAYVSLDVDLSAGRIVQVSGLSPISSWNRKQIEVPPALTGILGIEIDDSWLPGSGITYADQWITLFDESSGWVQIGGERACENDEYVSFATDTIAAVRESRVVGVWIRPVIT